MAFGHLVMVYSNIKLYGFVLQIEHDISIHLVSCKIWTVALLLVFLLAALTRCFCFQLWMIIQRAQHHMDLAFVLRILDMPGSVIYVVSLNRSFFFILLIYLNDVVLGPFWSWILTKCSYERADPNYVMLTPSKEHLAPGVLREYGKRPMFQTQIDSGNYDHLPTELKPIGKIF